MGSSSRDEVVLGEAFCRTVCVRIESFLGLVIVGMRSNSGVNVDFRSILVRRVGWVLLKFKQDKCETSTRLG